MEDAISADLDDVIKTEKETVRGAKTLKPTDRLEEYLELMDAENLHELEVSEGDFHVKLVRHPLLAAAAPVYAPRPAKSGANVPPPVEHGKPIKSPLAGIFYRSPSPAAAPFVKEGDIVTADKTLCIIEAMKVLNEINAGVSGKILKILVENGKPISSGQTLFLVEPS